MAYSQMPVERREEVAANLVVYLRHSVHQISQPGMSPFIFHIGNLLCITVRTKLFNLNECQHLAILFS